jgi:hypothetical protein
MLDRRRELLGALDPVELVEEAPETDADRQPDHPRIRVQRFSAFIWRVMAIARDREAGYGTVW